MEKKKLLEAKDQTGSSEPELPSLMMKLKVFTQYWKVLVKK